MQIFDPVAFLLIVKTMTAFEFNQMDEGDRYNYNYGQRGNNYVKFICFRKEKDYTYFLWDCKYFFVEMCHSCVGKNVISIHGLELADDRINYYIDFAKKAGIQ